MPTAERQAAFQFIEPKIKSIRERVFQVICAATPKGGISAKDIATAVNAKVHTVTGRIDELWDEGLVFGVATKGNVTKYRKVDAGMELHHSNLRRKDKFRAWVKKGQKRYGDVIPESVWGEIYKAAGR